ncbi:hypothetical protein BDC45DRAFT_446625, partial [Circinella umbellata]
RRQQAAARAFSAPPPHPSGFSYIYLPTRARYKPSQLRARFRQLKIENNHILDIHYPTRNIATVLIHDDFITLFKEHLAKIGIYPINDFNPTDPKHLQDTKYTSLLPHEQDLHAKLLYTYCMARVLERNRSYIARAIARNFQ